MYLQISRFRSLIYIANSLAMNSLWTVAFSCCHCRCLQKGAKLLLLHLPPGALCGSVPIHPFLKLGSFKVLVIRTVDFCKVVTFTLLCLYCHNCLKGSHVLLCKFLDSHCKNRACCMQWRCEWDNGTATGLSPGHSPFLQCQLLGPSVWHGLDVPGWPSWRGSGERELRAGGWEGMDTAGRGRCLERREDVSKGPKKTEQLFLWKKEAFNYCIHLCQECCSQLIIVFVYV